jgi:hypothetical protein
MCVRVYVSVYCGDKPRSKYVCFFFDRNGLQKKLRNFKNERNKQIISFSIIIIIFIYKLNLKFVCAVNSEEDIFSGWLIILLLLLAVVVVGDIRFERNSQMTVGWMT